MMLPIDDITSLIPQKSSFVMVSSLLSVNEVSTRSRFYINGNNVFVKNDVFQEAGLMENIAQTAALRSGYMAQLGKRPVSLGYIGAVKDLEIFSLPKIGDVLETEITMEEQVLNMTAIRGKIWHNDQLIATCELWVFEEKHN